MSASDLDSRFVEAALAKELLSAEEGEASLETARQEGRPVSEVLVSEGLISARTRIVIERDVQRRAEDSTVLSPTDPTVGSDTGPITVIETRRDELKSIGGFEVLDKLGMGGMGAVYRARDTRLLREVALKVLAPAFAEDREAADRFLREARASASINHPNVITVHAVGEEGGRLYMAIELLTGGDAGQLADRSGGRLEEKRALEIVRDCARGLVAIEKAGLVHRDIKPANIFITDDGGAKLADLGLARTQVGDDRMTQTGTILGTPAYMAPEQARGDPDLDVRTDIYALGASLYRLVTGQPPYQGSSPWVVVSNLLNQPPPDPGEAFPELSEATRALVLRAMAKDRQDRPASARELIEAVEEALKAPPGTGRPIERPKAEATTEVVEETSEAPSKETEEPAPPAAALGFGAKLLRGVRTSCTCFAAGLAAMVGLCLVLSVIKGDKKNSDPKTSAEIATDEGDSDGEAGAAASPLRMVPSSPAAGARAEEEWFVCDPNKPDARLTLYDAAQAPRALPARYDQVLKVSWFIDGVKVTRNRRRRLANKENSGFFCHMGLRAGNDPITEPADATPILWVTLIFAREDSGRPWMRGWAAMARTPRPRGVRKVYLPGCGLDALRLPLEGVIRRTPVDTRQPIEIRFELARDAVRIVLGPSGRLLTRIPWHESDLGDAFKKGVYLIGEMGSLRDRLGRARLKVEIAADQPRDWK